MVQRKTFLANPKHIYRVYQCGEHDCSANNKNNGDYQSIEVCPISLVNINYKENSGKKNISCKSKALMSCMPMWRP